MPFRVFAVWRSNNVWSQTQFDAAWLLTEVVMENYRAQALEAELRQLLGMQIEFLESRTFGRASDTALLEYEVRQDIIHELCDQLGRSADA
jgi:hypothetical protein